jgi:hypothetical protein
MEFVLITGVFVVGIGISSYFWLMWRIYKKRAVEKEREIETLRQVLRLREDR